MIIRKIVSFSVFGVLLCSCGDTDNQATNSKENTIYQDSSTKALEKKVELRDTNFEYVENSGAVTSAKKVFGKKLVFLSGDSVISYEIRRAKDENCMKWKLPNKRELFIIIKNLQEISGITWHDCYGDWSCGIVGDIMIQGKKHRYRFDAGGWIIINNRKQQKIYGCQNPDCLTHFPSDCFCDEFGGVIGE